MSRRVMILAAGVGSGHNQAAGAVEAALARRGDVAEVCRLDVLETTNELFQRLYDDGYFLLVRQAPWLVGWGYDNQDPPFKQAPVLQLWDQLNTTGLVRQLRDFDPDVVICTHFLPARLVSLMLARRQLRATLAVVTTDYDFQGLWLSAPFSRYFVAREETGQYLVSLGLPPDRVTVSGIPVRADLGEPVDEAAVRARFGLRPETPVVLVSAGAAGGSYTLGIVQQALAITEPCQFVVVCGRNAELKEQVDALVAGRETDVRVLGYTTEMADLMRVASLFVGKPGGLSSSECMAAGLPMVIINPIPGQEVRNADFLLESGAAVRCNYSTTVGYKIAELLADPDRLARMAESARRIGRPAAGATVAEVSLAAGTEPLWISRDAQRAMLAAGEQGVAAEGLDHPQRLRTIVDADTGGSLAVMTQGQLAAIGAGDVLGPVSITVAGVRALRWQLDGFDALSTGKWLLGDDEERRVVIT